MCCSIDAAFRQLHQDLGQCNGAEFAWAWLWQLLTLARVSSVRSQVGTIVAAVQSVRCLVRDYCLCPRAHPVSQHSRSSIRACNGRQRQHFANRW